MAKDPDVPASVWARTSKKKENIFGLFYYPVTGKETPFFWLWIVGSGVLLNLQPPILCLRGSADRIIYLVSTVVLWTHDYDFLGSARE